jgi:hypothetical protein
MTRNMLLSLVVLSVLLLATGCEKAAPVPLASPEPTAEAVVPAAAASPAVPVRDVVEASKVRSAAGGLPTVCTKLLTCCDAWVKVTPTAQVGCDAQRHAFRAAKTPEAQAKLGDLCEQALAAWGQLTDIPSVCK